MAETHARRYHRGMSKHSPCAVEIRAELVRLNEELLVHLDQEGLPDVDQENLAFVRSEIDDLTQELVRISANA